MVPDPVAEAAPPRVLIVEDNPLVAMMLEDLVADLGHRHLGSEDMAGPALRGRVEAGAEPALVDLDLADGPTGLGLVDALAGRGIASIMVSGQIGSVPERHGATALLPKPIDERALAGAIAAVRGVGGG